MTASLRIQSSKADSNTWESFTRSGLKLESVHQDPVSQVTTLRRLQEKGYQATSELETTSEVSYLGCGEKELSGPKSSFQMKVNFAFHLETRSQSLGEEWRGTDSMLLEVQCEVSTVSDDLGCHVICWCWSTVFSTQPSTRKF